MENYAIEMLNITKRFPGIIANDNITLQLRKGEIHALLGENGAGKSTLMSVLFGLYQPEEGVIKKDGNVVQINDPNDANRLGIGMVHQHFKLVECFSVLDNIILGVEPNTAGFLQKDEARKKVVALSEQYGLQVDPDAIISDITVGMQQRTEILKMLYRDNEILIFDEPTAVLTPQEIEELMQIMKGLAKEGKSILFISHKLNEIMEVADRCSVLRKGKYIGTVNIADTTKEELSRMMVGRDVEFVVPKDPAKPTDVVLDVQDITVASKSHHHKNAVSNVSFKVRKGEIVCIAGIDGNGQTELVEVITGLRKGTSGQVLVNGVDVFNKPPRYGFDHGVSSIPADRQKHGLVLDFSIEDNLILQNYEEHPFSHKKVLKRDPIFQHASKSIENYDIRPPKSEKRPAGTLSGGNQQKVIIAREVQNDKDLLIAVNPTRGLDVGAIEYVHKYIVDQRNKGKAVLLVSFELDEIMSLSDTIKVIFDGQIVSSIPGKEADENTLGLMMAGGGKDK